MNNKIFLFGEMYQLVSKYEKDDKGREITLSKYDKKIIKFITDTDREKLYKSKTAYEINKNTFIAENYTSEKSMAIIWNRYTANILSSEKRKGKDLAKFSSEEISGLMASIISSSENTKTSIYGFVEKYVTLQYNRGEILSNPIDKINKEDVVKVNKKMVELKMTSIEQVDKLLERMYTLHLQEEDEIVEEDEIDPKTGKKKRKQSKKGLNVFNFISILLSRYGILGRDMISMVNLRWEDINEEKMTVQIRDEFDNIKELPIDEIFLKWIHRAKLEDVQVNNRNCAVIDNGFVIKTSAGSKSQSEKPVKNTIYTNYKISFERVGEYIISFKDLKNSRIIELLLEIRKYRKVSNYDILDVISLFESGEINAGRWNTLANLFFTLFNEQPVKMNNSGVIERELAFDENAHEIASRFRLKAFGEDFNMPTPACIMEIITKKR